MSEVTSDPFDTNLRAMFAQQAIPDPPEDAAIFAQRVLDRIGKPDRTRLLSLGGAGAAGSAIAGTQFENFLSGPVAGLDGLGGQLLHIVGPETLVAVVMGLCALGFAAILPGRRYA